MRHPRLAEIPDELLRRAQGGAEAIRTRRLLAWLEHRNYRPTLADLEGERARRGHTPPAHPVTGPTERNDHHDHH